MQYPVLVFDIETRVDVNAGSHLYGLDGLTQAQQEQALTKIRRQESGTDFQRLPLHEIVCISGLWIDEKGMRLFSFTQEQHSEEEILTKFLSVFEKRRPVLVTWNGAQFDLAVIQYRTMYYGLSSPNLFDQGEIDQQRRYNNYQNRYHQQHIDLMDAMAMFNSRNFQKLNDVARFFGYVGKTEYIDALDCVQQQAWEKLSVYCEVDVLNTWFIYLRWLLLKGQLSKAQHHDWIQATQQYLAQLPHQQQFLHDWQKSAQTTAFTTPFFS